MRQLPVLFVFLALFLTIPWLGGKGFATRGEPREAIIAQSMLLTGDWILPAGYSGAVPSKPPLLHWLIAITSLPFGEVNEFTARFPSALVFSIFLGIFLGFLKKHFNDTLSAFGGIMLLSSVEWFRGSVTCRVDTVLACCLAGALISLFSWIRFEQRYFPVLATMLLACSVLTKGPVGVALPLLIVGLFLILNGQALVQIVTKLFPIGLMAVIPYGAWFLAGYLTRGDLFLQKVYYENIARFTSTMPEMPHAHSAFMLYGLFLLGLMPWSLFVIAPAVYRLRIPQLRFHALLANWQSAMPLTQYAFIVVGCFLLFFSIPISKRSVYLLPCYPFAMVLLLTVLRNRELS